MVRPATLFPQARPGCSPVTRTSSTAEPSIRDVRCGVGCLRGTLVAAHSIVSRNMIALKRRWSWASAPVMTRSLICWVRARASGSRSLQSHAQRESTKEKRRHTRIE